MPTSDRVDTLDPTTVGTNRVRLILDLTVAGRTHHVSTEPHDVEHEDGTVYAYVAGLDDVDWEQALTFFSDDPGDTAVPISVTLPDVDFAELAALGHDLAAGSAELSRHVEGTLYGQRQVVVRGDLSEPTFGALGEPFAFSVVSAATTDDTQWPPSTCVIDSTTWPDAAEGVEGEVYPMVIGTPGWLDGPDGGRIAGTPAKLIKYEGIPSPREIKLWFMVSGHRVRASCVWWRDVADSTSVWRCADVEHTEDGLGRTIAYIDLGHTGLTPLYFESLDAAEAADVWCAWAPTPGGHLQVIGRDDLNDNETFTISDGTTSIDFEFECTGGFVATGGGVVVVDVSDEDDPQLTRDQIVDAINLQDFGVRAARGGTYFNDADPANPIPLVSFVVLTNNTPGVSGNVAITDTVAHASFAHGGMEGGLDTYGGMEDPIHGGMLSGAGDASQFLLSLTRTQVDNGRWGANREALNAFQVGFYVDEFVDPMEHWRAHLGEVLPIFVLQGPDGLYPVLWRHDPSEVRDAAERFDVANLDAERVGPVVVSDPLEVANHVSVRWSLIGSKGDQWSRTETVDGSQDGALHVARVSHLRYGQRTRTVDSDVIYDARTAGAVAGWMACAYGLPTSSVAYLVERARVLHLELGSVVAVTDAELHWDGKLFHLVGLRDTDDGLIEITLRSIEAIP